MSAPLGREPQPIGSLNATTYDTRYSIIMKFSCPSIDLSNVDFRRLEVLRDVRHRVADIAADVDAQEAARIAREVVYTAVGFGVLAFQRAQVQRREVIESLQENGPTYFATVSHQAATALEELRTLVEVMRNPGRTSTAA